MKFSYFIFSSVQPNNQSVIVYAAGGDWEECYELVMKQSREDLTWTPGTNKILVMIGDARPHPPKDYGVYFKEEKLNWREEAKSLLNKVSFNLCLRHKILNTHRIFKRRAKALIRLRVCAGWSEPLLVAHTILLEISDEPVHEISNNVTF